MDRLLLSIGALSYAGVLALWLLYSTAYGSTDIIVIGIIVLQLVTLAGVGIGTTVWGLVKRGPIGFYGAGGLMVSGFILGALGFLGWAFANYSYSHTLDVCEYSKLFPSDPYAQWACPQVAASYYVMQTLAVSLLIPTLLALAVPSLAIRHRNRGRNEGQVLKVRETDVDSSGS